MPEVSFPVSITTSNKESLPGLKIYFDDSRVNSVGLGEEIKDYQVINNSIVFDLFEYINPYDESDLNRLFKITAQLTYSGENGIAKSEPEYALVRVKNQSQVIGIDYPGADTFNSLPGVYQRAVSGVVDSSDRFFNFNQQVLISGLDDSTANKVSFVIKDKSTGVVKATKIPPYSSTDVPGLYSYNLISDSELRFENITDMKEYTLITKVDGNEMGQKLDFFIYDDPSLEIQTSEDSISFGENAAYAHVDVNVSVRGGFERDIVLEAESFENDNETTYRTVETDSINTRNLDIDLTLKQDGVSSSQALSPLAAAKDLLLPIAVVDPEPSSKTILLLATASLIFADVVQKDLQENGPHYIKNALDAVATLTGRDELRLISNKPYFNLKLLKNGVEVPYYDDDNADYELEIVSALNFGEIKVFHESHDKQGRGEVLDIIDLTTIDEKTDSYEFILPDGQTKVLPAYSTTLPIKPNLNNSFPVSFIDIDLTVNNKVVEALQDTFLIIGNYTDTDEEPCLIKKVKTRANIDTGNAITQIANFFDKAFRNDQAINERKVIKIGSHDYDDIDVGDITEDIYRIIPQTEGPSTKRLGYCDSLASHIVKANEGRRNGLLRIFESQNHKGRDIAIDYNVYWLNIERLQHIYRRHGYQIDLTLFENKEPHLTIFNKSNNIVELIKNNIVNSSLDERWVSLEKQNDIGTGRTSFFKNYKKEVNIFGNTVWNDVLNLQPTSKLQVVTNNDQNDYSSYLIKTAFPLSRQSIQNYGRLK